MPTYEYECKTCGHTFDVFQNMSDEPVKICPLCGKEVRRLIHGGTGVIFKGSGFYVTDKNKSSGKTPASPAAQKNGKTAAAGTPAAGTGAAGSEPAKPAAAGKGAESAPKPKADKP
ncbi:MAG: zinc ribbon domain-containing protein [Treponema sp.]|jgi:putative FmdB family regulatory protein|nr:zinc ribbon domain-containing protein [Treponema sp.]